MGCSTLERCGSRPIDEKHQHFQSMKKSTIPTPTNLCSEVSPVALSHSILYCHGLEEENKPAGKRQPQKSTRRLGQWRRHEKNLDEFCGSRMTDFLQGHNILEDVGPPAMR